jgi:hypothetical protein
MPRGEMLDVDDDRPSFPLRADLTVIRAFSTICCIAFNYGLFLLAGKPSIQDEQRMLLSQTFCSNDDQWADTVFDCSSGLQDETLNSFSPRFNKAFLVEIPFVEGWLVDYEKLWCKVAAIMAILYQLMQWRRGETGVLFSSGQVVRLSTGPTVPGRSSWRVAFATFGRTLGVPLALAGAFYCKLFDPALPPADAILAVPLDEVSAVAVSVTAGMMMDGLPLLCTSRRQTIGDLIFQCYIGQNVPQSKSD